MISKIFIRFIYLKYGEELMEIDVGTLISCIGGTFFFGIAVGEFIERLKNKQTYTNAYEPIISKYLRQKSKMFDKTMERIK